MAWGAPPEKLPTAAGGDVTSILALLASQFLDELANFRLIRRRWNAGGVKGWELWLWHVKCLERRTGTLEFVIESVWWTVRQASR
jgi:hypothetical protein